MSGGESVTQQEVNRIKEALKGLKSRAEQGVEKKSDEVVAAQGASLTGSPQSDTASQASSPQRDPQESLLKPISKEVQQSVNSLVKILEETIGIQKNQTKEVVSYIDKLILGVTDAIAKNDGSSLPGLAKEENMPKSFSTSWKQKIAGAIGVLLSALGLAVSAALIATGAGTGPTLMGAATAGGGGALALGSLYLGYKSVGFIFSDSRLRKGIQNNVAEITQRLGGPAQPGK